MNPEIIIHPWKLNATEEESKEEDKYYVSSMGIYLHGQLDADNGYDLCGIENFPNEESPLDGFDCTVAMRDGTKRKAKLFLWDCREEWVAWKGLIVQLGDDKYMRDAAKKRELKVDHVSGLLV